MITTELKELVKQEADLLKQYATKEELAELDFSELFPTQINLCIYGQMTGFCFSTRATELIKKCAKPFSKDPQTYDSLVDGSFKNAQSGYGGRLDYTAIEFYICQDGAKNANLIAYLKGETQNLEL